jgi:hypothetical protein
VSSLVTNVISAASVIAGAATAVAGAISARAAERRARADAKYVEASARNQAIEASDVEALSSYLFEDVGSIRISDYVRDKNLRERTRATLQAVTDFLGAPGEELPEPSAPLISPQQPAKLKDDELARAQQDIESGETWNGLARMRREIEIRLREVLKLPPEQAVGASLLLARAQRSGYIGADNADRLRYAIQICNAGVHGQPVDAAQAFEALDNAQRALAELGPGRVDE